MIIRSVQLYEDREDVTLTTYLHPPSQDLLNEIKRPAVLVCPGGAYIECSDREAEPVALRFAAMGYHAFVLRYSTYGKGNIHSSISGDLGVNTKSTHPAPIHDIGKAFLTIRHYSDNWFVNPDKIILCGFSAGAHNCALYSVYWNKPLIYEFFKKESELFRPSAAILGYGIYDYHLMFGEKKDPIAQQISDAASIAFFGTKSPSKELLDSVSPVLHVSENTPPTFLWSTAVDELVPIENTIRMANSLANFKIPFEVHIFESGSHGLSLADQSTASSQFDLDPIAAKWINFAEIWLKKRFPLPLPETPPWMRNLQTENIEQES